MADFFEKRFRDEFRSAYDAWIAISPLTISEAPPTPFAMDEYDVAARDEAEKLDATAEKSAAEVRLNIQRSSNYVLTVVLYAVVLFFAGMSTRLQNKRLRWVMTLTGLAVLIANIAWIATFPVTCDRPGVAEQLSGELVGRVAGKELSRLELLRHDRGLVLGSRPRLVVASAPVFAGPRTPASSIISSYDENPRKMMNPRSTEKPVARTPNTPEARSPSVN